MAAELAELRLGELYARASEELGSAPLEQLVDALNAHDPRAALLHLILARQAAADEVSAKRRKADAWAQDAARPAGLEEGNLCASGAAACVGGAAVDEGQEAATPSVCVLRSLLSIARMNKLKDQFVPQIQEAYDQLWNSLKDLAKGRKLVSGNGRHEFSNLEEVLHPAVHKRLSTPEAPLSATESRCCLVSCIEHGRAQAKGAKDKTIVVVLGNTGAGKSAFINLLHGCSFVLNGEGKMEVHPKSPVRELMRIGHSNRSETFSPQVEDASATFGQGFAFADCPGFLDNRGFEINVANAVNIKQMLSAAASVVVVVIINYHSLLSDRGKGIRDLLHILSGLFGGIKSIAEHTASLLLAVSQAPVSHPETGHPITLNDLKKKLFDRSGLDDLATTFLDALNEDNVFTYHLLDRGHESWMRRAAIVERIKRMVPISSTCSLFRSVVRDDDKESLRRLLKSLGGEVTASIAEGSYDDAAAAVTELLRLKSVDHDFVTESVGLTLHEVIGERMGPLRSMVIEPSQADGGDGIELNEASESSDRISELRRLGEARCELLRMVALLNACAGITEVEECLIPQLVDVATAIELALTELAERSAREAVEPLLQEVLRAAGENAVREVTYLPEAAARTRMEQLQEISQLGAEGAVEGESWCTNGLMNPLDHVRAIELQIASDKLRMMDALWAGHVDLARNKLKAQDELLLHEASTAFWEKVGSSMEKLQADLPRVSWARSRINDDDCEVISALLRHAHGPANLKVLMLSSNAIGNVGIAALSDATAHGAFCDLERLYLDNNKIADQGLSELASTFAKGRLTGLLFIDLSCNRICDDGMKALSRAIANGAQMAQLNTLYLYSNFIGDEGITAVVCSLLEHRGALRSLEKLWLSENKIGDAGIEALFRLISEQGLLSLKSLRIDGNPGNAKTQQLTLQELQKRGPVDQSFGKEEDIPRELAGMPAWWIA